MTEVKATGRALARHAALDALGAGQRFTGRTDRGIRRSRVHFVYLHAVPPTMHERFERLVDHIVRDHVPVSHGEAVRRIVEDDIDRPYVSFSFDDGFASCRHAAQVLERRGISACFFVPTGFVGCGSVEGARRFFGTAAGVDEAALTWAELEELKLHGHEIGNHTVSHPDLGRVSGTQVQDEIEGAAQELRSRLGECRHFAWPLGRWRHFGAAGRESARSSGHVSCASAERGAHTHGVQGALDDLCLRREHIMASWPWRHVRYFLGKRGHDADRGANGWPASWSG